MKKIILSLLVMGSLISCKDSSMKIDKAQYSGKDVSKEASIIRNKETKAAELQIETVGKWTLYAGNSVDSIDFSKPLIEGEGSGTFALNVSDSIRSYFQLVTSEGKAILAERHLPMTGGYNYRDLGGFKTTDGKFVKWGKIFRSDDLNHLTDQDLEYLSSVPLTSIVDFRSAEEMKQAPDKIPSSVKYNYPYSITPGDLMAALNFESATPEQMNDMMKQLNVLLVADTASIKVYKDFFTLLQEDKELPLMFHCSAGKDRTGMGTALILFALGVDENLIIEDYLASNTYLGDKYASLLKERPTLEPVFVVKKEYIEAGFDKIKKDHGSIDNYLTNVLGVDIPKFREKYLY